MLMQQGHDIAYAAERVGMSRAALKRAHTMLTVKAPGDTVRMGGREYFIDDVTEQGGLVLSSHDGRINKVVFDAEYFEKFIK